MYKITVIPAKNRRFLKNHRITPLNGGIATGGIPLVFTPACDIMPSAISRSRYAQITNHPRQQGENAVLEALTALTNEYLTAIAESDNNQNIQSKAI